MLLVNCEKELAPEHVFNCTSLASVLLENDSEKAGAEINAFLQQFKASPTNEDEYGRSNTLEALVEEINACPSLQVNSSCYNCIYTNPPQSEITVTVSDNGQEISRTFDLGYQDGKLVFLRMHAGLKGEMESFYYEETHCSDPWDQGGTVSDEVLKALVSKHLKDPLGVDYSDLRITHDGTTEVCSACSCTTGRIIRIEADKAYQHVLLENGFKIEEEGTQTGCNVEIYQHPDWATEDFKRHYTIQFPDNYEGTGKVGFEGNVFNKNRSDDQIKFTYSFCSPTYCEDFGDPLATPAPNSILAKDKNGNEVVLDLKKTFCQDDEIVGIFYFNNKDDATGKYFMKPESEFREGLTVYFPYSEYPEVENIVETISLKEGCLSDPLPVKSLEEEYDCANTKYIDIDLSEDYTIIRSQSAFNALVSDDCNPQIDFSSYDLVIGRKGLTSGNSSIEYRLRKACNSDKLQLIVVFHQDDTTVAQEITYHALIPKLGDEETVEVKTEVK